jgi:hypothetical protein
VTAYFTTMWAIFLFFLKGAAYAVGATLSLLCAIGIVFAVVAAVAASVRAIYLACAKLVHDRQTTT